MLEGIPFYFLVSTAIFALMFFAAFGIVEAYQNSDNLSLVIFGMLMAVVVFWLSLYGGLIPFIMAGVAFYLALRVCQ